MLPNSTIVHVIAQLCQAGQLSKVQCKCLKENVYYFNPGLLLREGTVKEKAE